VDVQPTILTKEQQDAARALAVQKKAASGVAILSFYQEGADKGDAISQFRLGQIYLAGQLCERDLAKAKDLFQKASAQGHKEATDALTKLEKDSH